MKLSGHAIERANERLSLGEESLQRMADKVFAEGLHRLEAKGHLRGYMDKLFHRDPLHGEPIVWGENVFIRKGEVLVTMWQLPSNLKRLAAAIMRKRDAARVSDQSEKPGAGNPARTCSGERDPKGDAQEEKPQ